MGTRVARAEQGHADPQEVAHGVRLFLRWCLDNDHSPALDRRLVSTWIAALLTNGAEPATAHARLLALKRFSDWLTEEGELDADPLLGMKPPKLDVKVVQSLTDDQLRDPIKACTGKEFRDRPRRGHRATDGRTGMRASEVCSLTLTDVDLAQGLAIVLRGKGGKGRVVSFGAQTATAVDRYIRARRRHRLADTERLWLGDRGRGFDYNGLYRTLKFRAGKAGISPFNPHQLPNTAATRCLLLVALRGSDGCCGVESPGHDRSVHPAPPQGSAPSRALTTVLRSWAGVGTTASSRRMNQGHSAGRRRGPSRHR